jgi:hypothetical protein
MNFSILFLFLFISGTYACVGNNPTQLSALKDLYTSTSGSSWKFPAGTSGSVWLSTNDYCSWQGIVCDSACNYVTVLELSGVGMKGNLPSSFAELNGLQVIDFSHNSINGTLPTNVLSVFGSLQTLNIYSTDIFGSLNGANGACTPTFQNVNIRMSNIASFDFSQCKGLKIVTTGAAGPRALNFPISYSTSQDQCYFPNLVEITLDDTFSATATSYFNLSCFCSSPMLEYLSANSNSLQGQIPNCLSALPKLQFLSLVFNSFTSFQTNNGYPSLEILDVSYNKLSLNFQTLYFPVLVKGIFNHNQIYGTPYLNVSPLLEILDLSTNFLTGDFPYTVVVPDYLQLVDMRQNPGMHATGISFGPIYSIMVSEVSPPSPYNVIFCSALAKTVAPYGKFALSVYVSSTYYANTQYYTAACGTIMYAN